MPSKIQVKNSFSKSHNSYHEAAVVQREMATRLVGQLSELNSSFGKVLELGSGTGVLTEQLLKQMKIQTLFCNDLTDCSSFKTEDTTFLPGDAEEIAYPENLDLIISNAVVQWFDDLPQFFEKSSAVLNRGGFLAFTTFGPENFREIRSVTQSGLDYRSLEELVGLLEQDYKVRFQREELVTLEFETPRTLLQHLKETGVNGLDKKSWTKTAYKDFCQNYPRLNQKCPLTYHPITIIAELK